MALGGGLFLSQNKVLPGSYVNFISVARATATLSDRGYAAMALPLNWGVDGEVFTVTSGDFQKNSRKIFGYDYTDDKMAGLRDLFQNITTLYCYKLGTGSKAANNFATAKYSGTRGNDIIITIAADTDGSSTTGWTVTTLLGGIKVDEQSVTGSDATTDALASNDYVDWKKSVTLTTTAAAAGKLTGGADPTAEEVTAAHSTFLDKIEPYSFNGLGCVSTEAAVKSLYVAFTKRMRDEVGAKFQCVVYQNATADYEGVVSVENKLKGESEESASMVYWVTGLIAGCPVNKSNTNKVYNGEFDVEIDYTQEQLIAGIKAGKFMLHNVNGDARVLSDINTLVNVTVEKGEDFKANQTIRVLDQIAMDCAAVFNNKYLGVVPNDNAGRTALWADFVKLHEELQNIRAIENFESTDITVSKGDTKKSVFVTDYVTPVNAMEQLYMTVYVE